MNIGSNPIPVLMADTRLSALPAVSVNPADADLLYNVDVSDTSEAATGTGKKLTIAQLKTLLSTLYDAIGAADAVQAVSLIRSNNLSDLANAGTARTNLSLGNVNNTSDANKPVSTLQQTALNLKANSADLGTASTLAFDTDGTLAADSDTRIATQKAVVTYVAARLIGALKYKGTTDCSGNPNYPSALQGDMYLVSVAGKIGGASGTVVEVGDWYIADADNAGGTEASVGTSWGHLEHNLINAVVQGGPLGTPSSGVATNLTGTASSLTAGNVTTNANLTGDVTSTGNATTIGAGKVTEAMQVLADNTTQNVSITKHGYAPKAPNDITKFLDGTGAYSVPAGGSGVAVGDSPTWTGTHTFSNSILIAHTRGLTTSGSGQQMKIDGSGSSSLMIVNFDNVTMQDSNGTNFTTNQTDVVLCSGTLNTFGGSTYYGLLNIPTAASGPPAFPPANAYTNHAPILYDIGSDALWIYNAAWVPLAGAIRSSTDTTNASATMTNITGLVKNVISGTTYSGLISIAANDSTAAEGLAFDLNGGTATFSSVSFWFIGTPVGATLGTAYSTALGTAVTATTAPTGDTGYLIAFSGVCNGTGTLRVRGSQVSHTLGTATFRAGGNINIQPTR